MKFGNVKLEEINFVVKKLHLSSEKSSELKKRLKENLTTFLPCDIPQEKIIEYSQSDMQNIIEFMFCKKTNTEEMESALRYTKHSYNIGFVVNRIKSIFETPEYTDKLKELYFLETFCTEEMIGKSSEFYYKWYNAVISLSGYKNTTISGKQVFDLYKQAYCIAERFAGEYLADFFQQMLYSYFLKFKEDNNTQEIIDFYNHTKQYNLDLNIYEYMVESNFTSQELNPQKYILDLWDSEVYINKCKSISFEIGLSTKELMYFLIEHNKINFVDIFALWDSGAEPVDIANEFGLEISDVQSFLKENIDKLKRKNDLWQLDLDYEDYYEDWI